MKKKRERPIAMLLAMMMLVMNLFAVPSWATPGDVAINEDNFPDANFMEIVKTLDKDSNGKLSSEELAVTFFDVSKNNIKNLKGIEHFTRLNWLDCSENQLTALDLSKNINLKTLDCKKNQLTALDLTNNKNLEDLNCSGNQLTTLALTNNKNLKTLYCYQNQLTTLDLTNNTKLETLHCYQNQLTTLNLSKNINLKDLGCGQNQLTTLNLSKNINLKTLYCERNQLTTLDLTNNTELGYLSCMYNQLTTLGLSKNINLKDLYCGQNQLTTLDLSNNTKLETIDCQVNQLSALDLSNKINLEALNCNQNQLTTLDLNNNAKLTRISCADNQLAALDLTNNTNIEYFYISNQERYVTVSGSSRSLDLKTLATDFDPLKMSELVGGAVSGNTLTIDSSKPSTVTYKYDTGHGNLIVTLYVKYGDVVTVTFNKNGHGGDPATIVKTIDKGSKVEKPSDPTDEQYDFGGWYTEAECTNKFDFPQAVNDNITLYAKWTKKTPPSTQYTLTARVDGGHGAVGPTSETKTAGETVTLIFRPDTGYEIDTVTVNGTLTTVSENFLVLTMNENKTVVVKFKPIVTPTKCTLTAMVTAGRGTVSPTSKTVDKGESVELTFAPDTGYELDTIIVNDKPTGIAGNISGYTIIMDKDKTVEVKFKAIVTPPPSQYTLTASVDGGHGSVTPESITLKKGTIIEVRFEPDAGYEIETVTLDGTDVKSQVEENKLLVNMYKNKTVVVKFKPTGTTPEPPTPPTTKYTLTASVDGGHGSVSPINEIKNADETVTLTFAPDAGYELDTVTVNGTVTGVMSNVLDITMNENKTVVVKFKAVGTPPAPVTVTITFDKNGGTGTMADVTKTKGESYKLPACGFTPPAGKEFKAWQVDGTEKNVGDSIVLDGDKNIKAVWKDIGSLPPTPYTPYPWTVYPGWYYNFEPPKPKEEKPATKMEMDWKIELAIGIGTIDRKINGADSKIKMDVAPYIRDGRTMLPIRSVAEALGFEVEWNKSTRTVVLKDNTTRVEIPVDTNKIIVNGTVYTSDVKPEIKNNRTMLPIANIARALGLKDGKDIIWNSKSKTVTIYRSILVK